MFIKTQDGALVNANLIQEIRIVSRDICYDIACYFGNNSTKSVNLGRFRNKSYAESELMEIESGFRRRLEMVEVRTESELEKLMR